MNNSRVKLLSATVAMVGLTAGLVVGGGYLAGTSPQQAKDPVVTSTVKPAVEPVDFDLTTALNTSVDAALAARLAAALAAADDEDATALDAARSTFMEGTLARDTLDWALATSSQRAELLSPSDIAAISERLAHWPGQNAMATSREIAMLDGLLGGTQLALSLGDGEAETLSGKIAIAKHHLLLGNKEQARALVAPLWHSNTLWPSLEASLPDDFADVLTVDDHRKRLFNMMVRERIRSAERFAQRADMEPLFAAWQAVIRNQKAAGDLIAALPLELLETPHGIFLRVEYARKRQLFDEAAALLTTAPADKDAIINPDAWWNERRIVSRSLREQGDLAAAYAVASGHVGGSATTQVDAAFHAGWYALRGLKDPDKARPHFEQILSIANGASSRARAHYWLAQTHKAMRADADAQRALQAAAAHSTVFYGQLAASELGLPVTVSPTLHDDTDLRLALRQAPVQAALLLAQAGDERAAVSLITGLAETTDDPALITAMIEIFNERQLHFAALRLAKRAAWIDRDIGQATHPVGALPLDGTGDRADLALAYAIARQESEFRLNAVSSADARGLLQLLPSTARGVAQRLDMPFEAARLTTDAAYNTRLGTQYLAEQLQRFDGSYVLTFIAYNAGPGRAREWIERFGDPRGLALDELIDWVEQIPFPETRGYVQKVMENLIVYKSKLGLKPDIAQDLRAGRAS